jgi:flagellar basal body-associated protein FliL
MKVLKSMNKKRIVIVIIIAVVAISIGLYTILPLFTNTIVDEPLPTASGMISGVLNDENLKLKQMH